MRAPDAALPPLGWNSWNCWGTSVDEGRILAAGEALVRLGLRELGYRTVVIDDGWCVRDGRDARGELVPDPRRFPRGLGPVAEALHAKGLKLGIYSDAAERTCGGYPGSLGHEAQDAARWAAWGVDFLKYDYCNAPEDQAAAIERYGAMGRALAACGRPILYSLCEWGGRSPHLWGRSVGASAWRVSGDLYNSWSDVRVDPPGWWAVGVDGQFDRAAALAPYGGPGGWNDLDMLVVGLRPGGHIQGPGLSETEARTHVTLHAIACSPLMIGADLDQLSPRDLALLAHPGVTAVNQDPRGVPARRAAVRAGLEAWVKPLADGSTAVALFNRGSAGASAEFRAGELGLLDAAKPLHDVWTGERLPDLTGALAASLVPHACRLLKVGP